MVDQRTSNTLELQVIYAQWFLRWPELVAIRQVCNIYSTAIFRRTWCLMFSMFSSCTLPMTHLEYIVHPIHNKCREIKIYNLRIRHNVLLNSLIRRSGTWLRLRKVLPPMEDPPVVCIGTQAVRRMKCICHRWISPYRLWSESDEEARLGSGSRWLYISCIVSYDIGDDDKYNSKTTFFKKRKLDRTLLLISR